MITTSKHQHVKWKKLSDKINVFQVVLIVPVYACYIFCCMSYDLLYFAYSLTMSLACFFFQVMSAEIGEDAECHAAKLLEVILLQCPGQVDHVS